MVFCCYRKPLVSRRHDERLLHALDTHSTPDSKTLSTWDSCFSPSTLQRTYEKSYDVCFPLFAKSKNTDMQRLWTARLLALDILQVLRNPVGTVHGASASLRLPWISSKSTELRSCCVLVLFLKTLCFVTTRLTGVMKCTSNILREGRMGSHMCCVVCELFQYWVTNAARQYAWCALAPFSKATTPSGYECAPSSLAQRWHAVYFCLCVAKSYYSTYIIAHSRIQHIHNSMDHRVWSCLLVVRSNDERLGSCFPHYKRHIGLNDDWNWKVCAKCACVLCGCDMMEPLIPRC
jgi:hypothetical protein